MKTLEEIQSEIKSLGSVDLFWTRKEIKYLPEVMKDDEHILYLTSGLFNGSTWLIVCTETRIMLLDKGMFFGLKYNEIPLDKVNSISYRTGLLFGSIEIWHGGAVMLIENCSKSTVKPFAEVVNNAIQKFKNNIVKVNSSTSAGNSDVFAQLERLASLMEKGFLSKSEFEQQKKKILDS